MSEVLQGGCLCGAVRYRAANPRKVNHCHCSQCRRQTGAAVATWVAFRLDDVQLDGALRWFRSSEGAERGGCPTCGSAMAWRSLAHPDWLDLAVGSLDHPERVRPDEHLFHADRVPWLTLVDDLPRHDAWPPRG